MKMIMTNFNHERLYISIGVTRASRVVLAAAFAYVLKREAFGKPLIDQPGEFPSLHVRFGCDCYSRFSESQTFENTSTHVLGALVPHSLISVVFGYPFHCHAIPTSLT